jgi:hypothetical protein
MSMGVCDRKTVKKYLSDKTILLSNSLMWHGAIDSTEDYSARGPQIDSQ